MIAPVPGRPEGDREPASPAPSPEADGPVRVELLFPELDPGGEERIDEILGDHADHRVGPDDHLPLESRVHRVGYGLDRIEGLNRLYAAVAERVPPDRVVVLVDGRRVPRATELWLPLLWTLRP